MAEQNPAEGPEDAGLTVNEGKESAGREPRPGLRMPHIYVILFALSVLAAGATYLIPANAFERVEGPDGREMIDPDTYGPAEDASPTSFMEFITAVPRGLVDAGEVVFFTFIIGGVFMVVRRTGIIENALDRLLRVFATRRLLLIPMLITLFAALASLIGTQELALVYIPVLIPVIIALGYDSITAVAIALIGTTAGFTAGVLNPINTGLAQQISGIETFSGAGLRAVLLVVMVTLGSLWTIRYARRMDKEPARSLVHGEPEELEKRRSYAASLDDAPKRMTVRQRISLLLALPVLGVTIWGVSTQGWFMIEMGACSSC